MLDAEPDSIDDSYRYSESFRRRAVKMWTNLTAPYSKSDDSDFIDSEEENSDDVVRPTFERPESIEDEFIQHLRRKRENARGRKHGYDSSSDESAEEQSEDDDEEDEIIEVGEKDEQDHAIESSEDEWVASKLLKATKNTPPNWLKSKSMEASDDDESVLFLDSGGKRTVVQADDLNSSSDESEANFNIKSKTCKGYNC